MVMPPGRASSSATVVAAAGAAPVLQPSTVVGVNEPVTNGCLGIINIDGMYNIYRITADISYSICSCNNYGTSAGWQRSVWLTVREASGVHASLIVIPPASASSAATCCYGGRSCTHITSFNNCRG